MECKAVRAARVGARLRYAGFGAAFKQSLIEDLGPWTLSASGWGETLPHEDNRITLDPDVKDKWGIPAARLDVRWRDNERAMDKDMMTAMAEMLDAAGCTNVRQHGSNNPPGHCIHEMGGARMSRKASDGVVNQWNQAWDVKNSFPDRRLMHGQLRVPESEHHVHGDHGSGCSACGGRHETRRGLMRNVSRRQVLGTLGTLGAAAALPTNLSLAEVARPAARLKQSVSRWCYGRIPLDDLCEAAKTIGYKSVELLSEKEWEVPKKHGMACAMANGLRHHSRRLQSSGQPRQARGRRGANDSARRGGRVPNIVVFSGNRAGLSDGEGIANCIAGLKRVTPTAERHNVTLCLEMLNSKVDHKDYQADHTAWAVQVVQGRQLAAPQAAI
jgi:hypothetical protein